MIKDTDLAWLAGIIDGEGSIYVAKQSREDRDRAENYFLCVAVQSTDPYMVPTCKEISGEGMFYRQKPNERGRSDTLAWKCRGKSALRVLRMILPYLRVKKEQALLAIEFHETTKKHWKHMLPEDYDKQARLYQELKDCKQRLKIGNSPL